jgi:hypothetical protein
MYTFQAGRLQDATLSADLGVDFIWKIKNKDCYEALIRKRSVYRT